MSTRRCSLTPDCPVRVREGVLGCRTHWAQVPPDVQDRVLRAYDAMGRSFTGARREAAFAYLEAIRVARLSLAGRGGRLDEGAEQ